jgi:hypothetical protein
MKKETFEDAIPKPNGLYFKLWKAKQSIGKVAKNSKNPHFKNNYADINALTAEVEPILLEHGLLLMQPINEGHVITIIMDAESGESINSSMKLPEIPDPQRVGSCITYFRRYTLQSLLALQTEDTDAQDVSDYLKKQPKTFPQDRFDNGLLKMSKGELTKEQFIKALEGYELTDVQSKTLLLL